MITKLTDTQRKEMKNYADKYIKIGLNTDRIDRKECIEKMNEFYVKILKRGKPRKIIFCESPFQLWEMLYYYKIMVKVILLKLKNKKILLKKTTNAVRNEVSNEVNNAVMNAIMNEVNNEVNNAVWYEVREEVRNEVRDEVGNAVINEVRDEVGNAVINEVRNAVSNEVWYEVMDAVRDEVRDEVGNAVMNEVNKEVNNEVWDEVRNEVNNEVSNEVRNEVNNEVINEVRNEVNNEVINEVMNAVINEVRDEVNNEVRNEVRNEKKYKISFIFPYLCGSFDSFYFMFYSFMKNVLNIKYKKEFLYDLYEWTLNVGYIYPLYNVCFISEKPVEINRRNIKLHDDNKPALKYLDGFSLYRMNGVKVPKWLVETPKEKLKIEDILKIKNVEIRAQGLRKIGIEGFQNKLKKIDQVDDYVLFNCGHLFDGSYIPILKMKNPSVPLLFHFEYVSPDCRTVRDAINWRYGKDITKDWNPCILT